MSNQKPRTIEEQIRLLRSRGMQFSSEEYAKECLSHISYFRLKYYWTDMIDEETEHNFLKGASFDDVIARYNFDRYASNLGLELDETWNISKLRKAYTEFILSDPKKLLLMLPKADLDIIRKNHGDGSPDSWQFSLFLK